MSRASWLGRPAGRHAAPARGRSRGDAGSGPPPAPAAPAPEPAAGFAQPWPAPPVRTDGSGLLGAPVAAPLAPQAPLVSPVTDEARAAAAATDASLPSSIPAGAEPSFVIDALGRKCPIPIIMAAQQINDVPVGSVIAVLADDPAAYPDIPAWCKLKSHDCVFRVDYATGWSFGIRRHY
jgi:tRNA 2-thiouridine synthesizing protein A